MRIASVLHDASPEPDGAPLLPTVALERDGALYRVSALARAFGSRYASLHDDADFHHVVLALGAAQLRELDERLKAGERPSSARILPGTFTWLPPCDTDRAALFTCGPYEPATASAASAVAQMPSIQGAPAHAAREPSFHIGSARALLGHEATVPLAPRDEAPDVEGSLAVILGDELRCATAAEAERAILGYSLLVTWTGGFSAQLGPALVTRDEAGSIASLRAQLRVDGASVASSEVGAWTFSPAESIAWISHHVPLAAGDVIGAGRLRRGSAREAGKPVGFGARVELAIERLGRLAGRPSRGPDMRAWRSPRRGD